MGYYPHSDNHKIFMIFYEHWDTQMVHLRIILAEEPGTLATRPYTQPVLSLLLAAFASAVFSAGRGATFILMGGRIAQRLRCGDSQGAGAMELLWRKVKGWKNSWENGDLEL